MWIVGAADKAVLTSSHATVFGDVTRFDELNTDGSLPPGAFFASYGSNGRLVGALTIGQGDELESLVKDLIAERAPFDALARELVGGRSRVGEREAAVPALSTSGVTGRVGDNV